MSEQQPNSVDIDKWLKLIRADGVGPVTFAKLIKHFNSIEKVFGASVAQLTKVRGIDYPTAEKILRSLGKFEAEAELELAHKLGVCVIHLNDQRYPTLLKNIYDPPPVLYIKGNVTKDDNLCIAIVGSRRCSTYGKEQASRFAHLLSSAGFTICSGLARGIDTAAHHGAIAANGRTIAVQGCGLANVFPPENKELFDSIAKSGACLSELPLTSHPDRANFPPRNRMIAGLSLATIVIEAAQRSGALITAHSALEYNREVMAIPGKIDSPFSKGTHQLIKQGAKLIESVQDVIEALGYIGRQIDDHVCTQAEKTQKNIETPLFDVSKLKLSDDEKIIYDCLADEPMHIEQIIGEVDLAPGSINAQLISLRLKGLIKQLPGSMFLKI